MNILLVNPKYPDTYWSFKHALKFISKKAANPPLGLLTVAALLPKEWNLKLVDMNVSNLTIKKIRWANYIFLGAMSVQQESVSKVIQRCKDLDKKIIAGGPLFTEEYELYPEIDHFVLNEAEITLPIFLSDLEKGELKPIYQTLEFPDIKSSPIPDFSLLKLSKYATLSVQYTRGCPFNCEFCDITALYGRKVRTKSTHQVISELEKLIEIGWKGSMFFVDDNFIGNKKILKEDLLPELISWMNKHNHPFNFTTEASINLADDKKLMNMMVMSGFDKVFVGIETPDELSLAECNKTQNKNRDMIQNIKAIQEAGMEVAAGFIVGFDNDSDSIFQRHIDFIQKSGIISAMVGLLNAPKSSNLYKRLKKEGRLLDAFNGDNTSYSMNFIPKMNKDELLKGYQKIIQNIYSSKFYYERVFSFVKNYNPPLKLQRKINLNKLFALLKSILFIGIIEKNRKYFWKLFFWSLFYKPSVFPLAITYSIYGYHYRKVFKDLS